MQCKTQFHGNFKQQKIRCNLCNGALKNGYVPKDSTLSVSHIPCRGYLNPKKYVPLCPKWQKRLLSGGFCCSALQVFVVFSGFRNQEIVTLFTGNEAKTPICLFALFSLKSWESVCVCVCVCRNTLSLSTRIKWLPHGCPTELWQANTAAPYLPCQPPPALWSWQCWSNFPATPFSKNRTASLAWALAGEDGGGGGIERSRQKQQPRQSLPCNNRSFFSFLFLFSTLAKIWHSRDLTYMTGGTKPSDQRSQ